MNIQYAEAIPWFKLQGTADQIRSSENCSKISEHIEIIEVLKFEKTKWNKAEYIEVITRSYPNFGKGGATQFITKSEIRLKRMINLKTGEIINFK